MNGYWIALDGMVLSMAITGLVQRWALFNILGLRCTTTNFAARCTVVHLFEKLHNPGTKLYTLGQ